MIDQYEIRVRDLPEEEKPREKLKKHGASALKNYELLAIILGRGTIKEGVLETGNIMVLAVTVILILLYVIDTHRIAKATEAELHENLRPMIGFELHAQRTDNNDIITRVFVTNNSRFFCKVYTDFNMQVYNKPFEHSPRYTGKEPWLLLPGHTTKGWFSISEVLQRTNRSMAQGVADQEYDKAQKLVIDVYIKAKGIPGGSVEYPKLH